MSATADRFVTQGLAVADEVPRLRREVVDFVRTTGASKHVVENVRLAVSEALTNVVLHAYLGRDPAAVSAEAWCETDHVMVRVRDEGHGLIPRAESPGLGVGISLMASMADDFRIANREGAPGTIVSLRFSLINND